MNKKSNYEIQYIESFNYKTIKLHFIPYKLNNNKIERISVNILLFDGLCRMSFNSRANYVPLFYGISCSNNIPFFSFTSFSETHDVKLYLLFLGKSVISCWN